MSRIKDSMATRCELALMGKVVQCSNEEVNMMTHYILSAIGNSEQYKDLDILKDRICRYSENNKVTHIVCNVLMGHMKCITYLIDTQVEGEPKPFEEDWGTGYPCSFSYVFNTDADDCSEFGDCFFQKKSDGFFHRAS